MRLMRILGFVILIAGIAALLFASYINSRIGQGKAEIENAQKKVKQAEGILSINPVTKELGKEISGGAQKKIDEGKDLVAKYEKIAGLLHTGGIVMTILGAGIVIVSFLRKKKG